MAEAVKAKLRQTEEEVFVYLSKEKKDTFIDCAGCAKEYDVHDFYMDNHKIKEYPFKEEELEEYYKHWEHKAIGVVDPAFVAANKEKQ